MMVTLRHNEFPAGSPPPTQANYEPKTAEPLRFSEGYDAGEGKRNSCRLDQIESCFFPEEGHAKLDFLYLSQKCEKEKVLKKQLLDFPADVVVRTVRSSLSYVHPERRLERNLKLLKKREKLNDVMLKNKVDPERLELFKNLVFPVKIYGKSKCGKFPIVKFSLSEANWEKGSNIFEDSGEFDRLTLHFMENLLSKMKQLGCKGKSANEDAYISSKFILILDLSGYNFSHLQYLMRLNFNHIGSVLGKLYPEILLKVYCLTNKESFGLTKHTLRLAKAASFFNVISKTFVKKVQICTSEGDLLEQLVHTDNFSISQLPNEVGGHFEGRYVLD
eukprot:snap_masked-scaffold_8-processed-gene-0.1-mRNA-1 protein AED:0.11 eAED:1.00 QI:0/-1/0/1/-1/1/1/0/331